MWESGDVMSEEEYLEGEEEGGIKFEYIGGSVYSMEDFTENHCHITGNVQCELWKHLKGNICEVFASRFKVKVGANYFYPDVLVDCPNLKGTNYYTESPVIIVEVTAKSTKKFDCTYKLDAYKTIPSLKEYVIVEQYEARVDVYKRAGMEWNLQTYSLGDSILFESIGLTLSVEEIYDRVDNEDMQEYLRKKGEEQKTG